MTQDLIMRHERAMMLAHGARSAAGEDFDPKPVVKLFTPDGACTWLLTELDPEDPDKRPDGPSLKLLNLVKAKGLKAIA